MSADARVAVVRGEMSTGSDLDDRGPDDPALAVLLAHALPPADAALVVGPHSPDVVAAVAARHDATTVLVRSVADATTLAETLPGCSVVAGSLEALAPRDGGYATVVAADGLDRVLGTDAPDAGWEGRLGLLRGHARPGATLVVGLANDAAVTAVLDRRPEHERHGDEDWTPLHGTPGRPASVEAFVAALAGDAGGVVRVWAASAEVQPRALVALEHVAAGRTSWAGRALLGAIGRQADTDSLLAPPGEALDRLARAGRLAEGVPAWLAVVGASAEAPEALAVRPASAHVAVGRPTDAAWRIDGGGDDPAVGLTELGPSPTVPDGDTVEDRLLAACAAEDVPAVRTLAAELARCAGPDVVAWDHATPDRDGLVADVRWRVDEVAGDADDAQGVAWHRFAERLLRGRSRHPWPPWMDVAALTATFVEMGGGVADAGRVAEAGRVATLVADALGERAVRLPTERDLLDRAEAAERRADDLAGYVFGLERTLAMRDASLRRRDRRVADLRDKLEAERARRRATEGAGGRLGRIAAAARRRLGRS